MGSIYADFLHLPHHSIYSCAEVAQEESDTMKLNLPAIYNILAALGLAALGGVLEYLKVEGAAYAWGPLALVLFNSLYQALKVQKSTVEPPSTSSGQAAAVSRGESPAEQPGKMRKFLLG